jgi:serine/threonine protein kinase
MVLQQPFLPGELPLQSLFRERYFILNKVGSGGFGSVYKAIDKQCEDHLVAIKEVRLLASHSQALSEAISAFQHEVSLLSQLNHPNLPCFYEHFETAEGWYLVMDFIAGKTLEDYQSEAPNKKLLLSEVLAIGIQLCTILEFLHAQQPPIIFRDLKPSNIMHTPTGKLYLIDFGIARFFKPGQVKDTMALGSPGYAAPEQYGKAQTTTRADIYALGAVLHQLLTTRDPSEAPFRFPPLRPKSPENYSEPGSLTTSMVDTVVNKLETLLASMLEMDVNKRPPNVVSIKQELHILSTLWSDIHKSYWRPRLGYTSPRQI